MPMTRFARLSAALLLASSAAGVLSASANLLGPEASAAQRQLAQAAGQSNQPAMPVSLEQALYLIRSTLITLNDANRSGNYTVLRDLASPGFQANNTAADLSQIFADLRKRNIDLHAVAIAAPQLSAQPHIDNNKMLRLTGYFPTQPLQINFDLLFQNVAGHWRLFGISVGTPQAAQQPAASKPKPAAPRGR
jgi:hypothetical protein